MGGEAYFYCVKYQANRDKALQELRQREFQAGRYYPAMDFLQFPVDPSAPAPGAQHASIEEAFEDADADATRSILDLDHFSDEPDFGAVTPLSDEALKELYGTTQPTHEMIAENMDFLEDIDRGQGTCITIYKDGKPDEIFFAGYSYD
jgi:hypothetical protein